MTGDPIWEHKKGRIWRIVADLTHERNTLRWKNRVLQARVRRGEIMVDAAFKEAERYRELYLLDHPESTGNIPEIFQGGVHRVFGTCSRHGAYELPLGSIDHDEIPRCCPRCT